MQLLRHGVQAGRSPLALQSGSAERRGQGHLSALPFKTRHGPDGICWRYCTDLHPEFSTDWFDDEALRRSGHVQGLFGAGRARALKLQIGDLQLVLRRFRRGGLISRLVYDSYVYIGLERTRAFREFELLGYLQQAGLPAPAPVAAEIRRDGLFYRASLLMQQLPGVTLAESLSEPLPGSVWFGTGACIRRFHDAGIWHADLNAHNILLGDDGCHLIDFDRARRRNPADNRWRQRNLERLQRSVHKLWPVADQLRAPALAATAWQALLDGYAAPL